MLKFAVLLFALILSNPVISNTEQQLQTDLNLKHYSRAAQTGLAILRQQPDNVRVKFLTAVAFQHNDQTDIAKRYYSQLIKIHPELPEPRNNLAMILMKQGQYDQAIELLIASMKTHPAYATAWQNLNLLYQGLASEAYRKALSKEKNPGSVMNKIKLSALTTLHDFTPVPVKQPEQPVKMIQIAAKPAINNSVVQAVKPQQNTSADLIKPLQDWADAWSQKNFKKYTNAYTSNYKGGKSSHQQWVDYRRTRIVKPGTISVKLSNFQIKSYSQSRVIIDFQQQFSSSSYKDKVIKRIYLTKVGDSWKIFRELTIAVL